MQQLITDEGSNFSLGAKILKSNFYVDDMFAGGNTAQEKIAIRNEVSALLVNRNFLIRKWCSNDLTDLKIVKVFLNFMMAQILPKLLALFGIQVLTILFLPFRMQMLVLT